MLLAFHASQKGFVVVERRRRRSVAGARCGGFTLIEMLTTVAVLAVSLALAAPALSGFVRSNRVRAAQAELVSSLMLARSEAARLGTPVGVEAKASVADGGLARGWRVWVDANGNNAYDAGEPRLRDVADLGSSVVITGTPATALGAVYSPRGFLLPLAGVVLAVCGKPGEPKGYQVRIAPVGLADIAEVKTCP